MTPEIRINPGQLQGIATGNRSKTEASESIRGYPLESKPDLVDDNPSVNGAASEAA